MNINKLSAQERIPIIFSRLFERYGYRKYRMAKFEAYDMYMENKSFLVSEGIITFTNTDGRLMALKPDVTLSIVKNTAKNAKIRKLYYNENVFRTEPDSSEYKEIRQMGVEFIGGDDIYSETEVLLLAASSLASLGEDFILRVGHTGLLNSLIEGRFTEASAISEIYSYIRRKNADMLRGLLDDMGIDAEYTELLCDACCESFPFAQCAERLKKYALNDSAKQAYDRLVSLADALKGSGFEENIYFDFSVTGDMDYYNGLIFSGYMQSSPYEVLSGGRYDKLMRRFGKTQAAIGFAAYLDRIEEAVKVPEKYDTDALLIYADADALTVRMAMEELLKKEDRVCALKQEDPSIKAKHTYKLIPDNPKEVV